jgi:glycosyltransferase involved in cell wall biosynthesis
MPFFGPKAAQENTAMPVIVTVHDVAWLRVQAHAKWYARYYFGPFALARYRRAARIVVDSKFSQGELLTVFADDDPSARVPPIEVVYPGVSEEFFHLTRVTGTGDAPGSRREPARSILVVGTVERRKNLELLVRALPGLPDARIVSVGPFTPYADECRALAAKLGVNDRVELRGYVTRDELLRLYATCAVVAVPSTYEGFGYAAAQALCAGVPVIVSDRSSLPEVVRDDAPCIPIDNVDGWITILGDALDGKLTMRADASRTRSIKRFAWNTSGTQMLQIYEKAAL